MGLIRSVLSVSGLTILSRLTGFIREMLQAHYIGVNAVSDALNIAIKIPALFRRIFAEGAFNASFIPLFSGILTQNGKEEAFVFARRIFSLLMGTLLILIIILEVCLDDLIPLLFRGLQDTPERLSLTIQFSKITLPFLLFISLTAFFSGILNSFKRFIAAAGSPIAGNLFIIACLVMIGPNLTTPGYALAFGILGCGVVQFLWVYIPCLKSTIYITPKMPRMTPQIIKFLKILLPAALGSGVVQINLFIDIWMASYLKIGGISYMNYADRLSQLPLSVIGIALTTVLLPVLAQHFKKNERDKALYVQNAALEVSMTLAFPAMICLIIQAPFFVHHIYEHGEFTLNHVMPTANTLRGLASGLPAYIIVKLFSTTFFSNGNTRTPMKIGIISVVLNFFLNLILINRFEYVGFAIGTSISCWCQAGLLGYILYKQKLLSIKSTQKIFFLKLMAAAGTFIFYLTLLHPFLEKFLNNLNVTHWLTLGGSLITSFGMYIMIIQKIKLVDWLGISKQLDRNF